jgi:hypothetical protein
VSAGGGCLDPGQLDPEVDPKNPPGSQAEVQLKSLLLKRKKPPSGGFWIGWLPKKWRCRYRSFGPLPPA